MFGDANLLTIFTTGLVTGGLSCLAVQGGLLTATLAQQEEDKLKEHAHRGNAFPIFAFLLTKLIAYTLLGFFLGWLGSLFQLSVQARVLLQLAVVIFMVGTALNLLNVHPIFRYFAIQPPRFLTRLIRKQSKRKDIFAPALLGAFTVFIPCGTTQAMMALAIASGQPIVGALILFTFILGTSPVFFALGYLTMKLGDVLKQRFLKIAAFALILLALFNLDATIALAGSPYTFRTIGNEVFCVISYCQETTGSDIPVTEATIEITPTGYSPNRLTVQSGTQVKLHLVNKGAGGCVQAFTIPALNVQKIVTPNTTGEVTFTAPKHLGRLVFTCSMGMYPGTIDVI